MEQILLQNPIISGEIEKKIESSIRHERSRVFSFIRKRVPSLEDAEDIMQDVFYQFVKTIRGPEPIERVANWLVTAAGNKIIDFYRKKKNLRVDNSIEDESGQKNLYFDFTQIPEDVFTQNMIWEAVEEALEELPANQKDIFILNEFEGKSFKEISSQTGLPLNTLLSRKRYAVLHLRAKLEKYYKDLNN